MATVFLAINIGTCASEITLTQKEATVTRKRIHRIFLKKRRPNRMRNSDAAKETEILSVCPCQGIQLYHTSGMIVQCPDANDLRNRHQFLLKLFDLFFGKSGRINYRIGNLIARPVDHVVDVDFAICQDCRDASNHVGDVLMNQSQAKRCLKRHFDRRKIDRIDDVSRFKILAQRSCSLLGTVDLGFFRRSAKGAASRPFCHD